jgi:hypothetical protein
MPLYRVKCPSCQTEQDIFRSFETYDDLPECCGERTARVICAPLVHGDIQPYVSMIDGSHINSRSRHREHLKTHGCIEVGNEKVAPPKPIQPPAGLKETLIRNVNAKLR